ncbi:MAG: hypothetical protein DCC68_24920 [Planctomycetota bacterium]|nr:MAG: hypothetical protein DCC68_24920 [Planctomycetota bacterium]
MSTTRTAAEVLEREFLVVRARLLETAAAFDRLDRAEGNVASDPRSRKLRQALDILAANEPNRAEQLQLLFSLPYEPQWRSKFGLAENGKANRP